MIKVYKYFDGEQIFAIIFEPKAITWDARDFPIPVIINNSVERRVKGYVHFSKSEYVHGWVNVKDYIETPAPVAKKSQSREIDTDLAESENSQE